MLAKKTVLLAFLMIATLSRLQAMEDKKANLPDTTPAYIDFIATALEIPSIVTSGSNDTIKVRLGAFSTAFSHAFKLMTTMMAPQNNVTTLKVITWDVPRALAHFLVFIEEEARLSKSQVPTCKRNLNKKAEFALAATLICELAMRLYCLSSHKEHTVLNGLANGLTLTRMIARYDLIEKFKDLTKESQPKNEPQAATGTTEQSAVVDVALSNTTPDLATPKESS